MVDEVPLDEEFERFLSKVRTKERLEVDHQAWANSKAGQSQLSAASGQDLNLVKFGRAVRYPFQTEGKILLPRRLVPTGCIPGASWRVIAGH